MPLDSDIDSKEKVRSMIKRAKEAQSVYSNYTQEQADYIIKKVAEVAYNQSEYLAKMAVEETGMGIVEHKKMKNELTSRTLYESIKNEKTIGVIHEDLKNKMTEIASPFGVIGCIIPTTNPTSTAIFKTIIALKTLNAIVVSPHPSAEKCTIEALKVCEEAAVEAGAPKGLINYISNPSIESTTEMMHHDDIDLILSTGGGQLVKAAYSSGKPAYGVGPGNVPVYIERTANVPKATKKIIQSKSFDNGTICSTEQAVVIDSNIKQMAIRELKNNGAYFLNNEEKEKIENIISPDRKKLNTKIVGKSAKVIADMAGISIPKNTKVLMAEEHRVAQNVPLSIEKLSPILPLYTVSNIEEGEKTCLAILENGGKGHTMSLHTKDDNIAKRFGLSMPASRIMVNTLSSIGAAGATSELMPSMTLGCGSFGGNITADNITAHHLINIKRVAFETKEVEIPFPSFDQLNENHQVFKENNYADNNLNNKNIEKLIQQVLQKENIDVNSVNAETMNKLTNKVLNMYSEDNLKEAQSTTNSGKVIFSKATFPLNHEGSNRNNNSLSEKVNKSLERIGKSDRVYNPDFVTSLVESVINNNY